MRFRERSPIAGAAKHAGMRRPALVLLACAALGPAPAGAETAGDPIPAAASPSPPAPNAMLDEQQARDVIAYLMSLGSW
jgi:mono/diheme cytochrome c family protein